VDHGGTLWIWEGDGYKYSPLDPIFYDMDDIYD
jgi:hypothetical protein